MVESGYWWGYDLKEIKLTRGMVTIVDDEDFEWLNQWKWHAMKCFYTFYAARRTTINKEKSIILLMHREILNLKYKDGNITDHKDRNGLNNQRENLRRSTSGLNNYNSKIRTDNFSGYRGVSWHKMREKWQARICINKKEKFCGLYHDIILAAKAYDQAAMKYYRERAILNFPEGVN